VLETGFAALPTVAKLIKGFDGIVQKSRILLHAVGLEWQGFSEGRTVREEARGGFAPPCLSFEIRGFCSSTADVFVHSVPGWP
jgi:hypothetical protein